MELKAASGNNDMFDALKKMEKKKKADDKKREELETKRSKADIFDFINSKLHGKKGELYFIFLRCHSHLTLQTLVKLFVYY